MWLQLRNGCLNTNHTRRHLDTQTGFSGKLQATVNKKKKKNLQSFTADLVEGSDSDGHFDAVPGVHVGGFSPHGWKNQLWPHGEKQGAELHPDTNVASKKPDWLVKAQRSEQPPAGRKQKP